MRSAKRTEAAGETGTAATRSTGALIEASGRYAVLPILLGVLIFARVENDTFFTWDSIELTLRQNASVGIIAVGLTFVLIGGGIDISVGSLYAAGASVYTKESLHHSLPVAFLMAVLVGVVAGTVNGLLVTKFKFNAFVATLGTASLFGGLVVIYAGNQALVPNSAAFGDLGNDKIGSLSYVVIILLAVFLLGALVLHRTSYGKSLYAVGGGFAASHLAGLRTSLIRLATYVTSGVCATVAGVIYASQTGISESDLGGNVVALTAVAIVVLGGTSLFGGEGAMWRTIVGFAILASISTLFTVLAVEQPIQDMIQGGIVVAALVLDAAARNRSAA
jgi:ribose transport system permease protein